MQIMGKMISKLDRLHFKRQIKKKKVEIMSIYRRVGSNLKPRMLNLEVSNLADSTRKSNNC